MSGFIARRFAAALGIAAVLAVSALPARAQDVLGESGIRGAGSSFFYPVLSRWSREYRTWLSRGGDFPAANAGLEDPPASSALQYEPVGSLAGALRLNAGAVDFGASDMPLRSEELAALGLGQFPVVIGAVVVAVNVEGVRAGEIRFTGPVLAEIFLGTVSRWSDPAIKALNPALTLPDAAIAVVHRSDGSGTTFNFTDYLSKASPEWKLKVGSGLLVPWPTGSGARGNEGVAQTVSRVRNSIGYVEYAQAMQVKLSYALIRNRTGQFVAPDTRGVQAAAATADWNRTSDFYLLVTDSPGERAYPLTATVFVLMQKAGSRTKTLSALGFFGGRCKADPGPQASSVTCRCQRRWFNRSWRTGPEPSKQERRGFRCPRKRRLRHAPP